LHDESPPRHTRPRHFPVEVSFVFAKYNVPLSKVYDYAFERVLYGDRASQLDQAAENLPEQANGEQTIRKLQIARIPHEESDHYEWKELLDDVTK
jgi:hypothetical protein